MNTVSSPRFKRGESSLLISVPHAGIKIPTGLLHQFMPAARALPDTDWHVDRLYDWAPGKGAGLLVAPMSRYVIDLNRPPDDTPLYDKTTSSLLTGLVPVRTFSGFPVYAPGHEPSAQHVRDRLERYWQPYHRCLCEELERIKQRHGYAVLLDAHSIRSRQPLLFDGALPDLNLGSNGGSSATRTLIAAASKALQGSRFSMVLDGRFKGGYITRHYGSPATGVHALQLEIAQSAYMQEDPPCWQDERAVSVQAVLHGLVEVLMQWKPNGD
ncbi:MAG TPA: N-formylglutamate deformylase [Xanthomonadales bacterium]|nr:N-formylglutamate deformylase [Xanthomonadales bacterium]